MVSVLRMSTFESHEARITVKRLVIGIFVLALLAVCMLTALHRRTSAVIGQAPEATATLPPVRADHQVMADGRVVPVRRAEMNFVTTGVVAEVLVAEGDHVEAEQVLARLDAAQQTAAVQQAEANLARAQAAFEQLMARPYPEELAVAEAALARAQETLNSLELIGSTQAEQDAAQAGVDEAQAELDALKASPRPAEIDAAKAEVDAAEAAVAQARAVLAATELRTPLAGTITYLRLQPGQITTPGQPVVRIADVGAWQIETTDLTELDIVRIKEGDPTTIRFDAIPDLELTGTITHIGSYGEQWQGDITYTVIVTPNMQDERLRWNMTASLTIEPEDRVRTGLGR
jgi:multidrug efflux pump subunit AcrA (membrane-fusion protein)